MKRPWRDIRNTAWHEGGHAIFNLAVIDPQTHFHLGHPSFKGIWVAHDTNEKSLTTTGITLFGSWRGAMGAVLKSDEGIWCSDYEEISLYMAGLTGQRILNGRKRPGKIDFGDWISTAAHDIQSAHDIAEAHIKEHGKGFQPDAALQHGLERAWNILKVHAKAHQKMSNELERAGYMTYERAKEIFEEGLSR